MSLWHFLLQSKHGSPRERPLTGFEITNWRVCSQVPEVPFPGWVPMLVL